MLYFLYISHEGSLPWRELGDLSAHMALVNGGGGQTRAPHWPVLKGPHATGKHFCLLGGRGGGGAGQGTMPAGGGQGRTRRDLFRTACLTLLFPTCLSIPLDFSAPGSTGRIASNAIISYYIIWYHSQGQQETRHWWPLGDCFQIQSWSVYAAVPQAR